MDEDDRSSASSPESERRHDPDDAMDDAEAENDAEQDDENNEDDDENHENNDDGNELNGNDEGEGEGGEETQYTIADASGVKSSKSSTPAPFPPKLDSRPRLRPETITARLYDIVPTMAAPQSTSVNAMAITPDLRYWITGGSDGYIRKYDGPGTINGKLPLTVAQKHPFVDSVTKAGILMSYWENDEPSAPGRNDQDHTLSPVYSLAVHSEALWLLSGLESGGINLQSVRHDEGKKITCLQKHTNAVSSLVLAPDERSVLSGGWDKIIYDWDLNTGQIIRSFDGCGNQISSIELRPASGDPVPAEADEPIQSNTISTNNGVPLTNGVMKHESGVNDAMDLDAFASSTLGNEASPAHESLFGGSDAGSLFGETAGEQPFGNDDDTFGAGMNMMPGHEGGMDHSADFAMADLANKPAETSTTETMEALGTPSPGQGQSSDHTQQDATAMEADKPSTVTADSIASALQTDSDSREELSTVSHQPEKAIQVEEAVNKLSSPGLSASQQHFDQSQVSATTFLSSAIDGTIRIWDRRVPHAVARIGTRTGVPPWCMSACWSPDGNMIYAGRRNGTVEEFDVRKARRAWEPERALKFPAGSGAVSAVRSMPNGRHLVCASHDILRLYDLRDTRAFKHSTVPFLIIPGPPRAGVISALYIDPTCTFMLSAGGTRGWEGNSTEVLIGYEINVVNE